MAELAGSKNNRKRLRGKSESSMNYKSKRIKTTVGRQFGKQDKNGK